ncbi:MAG: hypothetical protein IPL41_05390 [Micropruina sp.]|nr:hypothetical protein [Micropruina sp.]
MGALHPLLVPLDICPTAPPGAQKYADQITGYVLWGVISLFLVGVVVSVGAIVAGRVFNMPHASKYGVVGIFVVLLAVIAYLVAPGIVQTMLGAGCV